MKNPVSKIPFLFLLLPLIAGILLQYFFKIQYWSIAFFLIGTGAMLSSYLIPKQKQFNWRWMFGMGAGLFVVGIGMVTTSFSQQKSEFSYLNDKKGKVYRGIVTDTPQEKAKTTAYRVYLPDEGKQIVCYFWRDSLVNERLSPGEEFLFYGQILPFRNMGNPDDFDYVRYMYNQGFVGSVYLPVGYWGRTGNEVFSLKYIALRCRQQIMDFYKSLGLNDTEYSILTALTLGYKNELSDELKQGFRTTGTVHVLSVSGLHVGIIYLMISFLLGFIRRASRYYWIKPVLIILLLWVYAFITGLPPSVVRASGMLTVFCAGEIFGKKSFSIHALYIAAFFILLISPFSLFDIGFQLSFMSVLSILYLQPRASNLIRIENRYIKKIWQLFTLSLVAQLATFPICLYYFGTFPTYFFITNLLIVPLVTLIMYVVGVVIVDHFIGLLFSDFSYYIYYLPVKILQLLVELMTTLIRFFENLPMALIDNVKISFADMVLVFTIIVSLLFFFIYKKAKALVFGLIVTLLFITIRLFGVMQEKENTFVVYNRSQATEIKWNVGNEGYMLKTENTNSVRLIDLENQRILILSENIWSEKVTKEKMTIDYLILTKDNSLSMYSLNQLLEIKSVIIDASLSVYARRRISKECQKLNIPCHDVVENGAFSMNF